MKEARQLIEQLETDKALAIAEAKQQMHGMMEGKDTELITIRNTCQQLKQENETLQAEVSKLKTTGETVTYVCVTLWACKVKRKLPDAKFIKYPLLNHHLFALIRTKVVFPYQNLSSVCCHC